MADVKTGRTAIPEMGQDQAGWVARMKCALAIFVKTIGSSPVKTRLAASIGKDAAENFYRLSVACVQESIALACGSMAEPIEISPHWAVGEQNRVEVWNDRPFPAIWTGEGGLGPRFASLTERLFQSFDAVIFVGTDSPQLSPDIYREAFDHLRISPEKAIIGPAFDGGFYLFGSTFPVSREVWEGVTYSNDETLSELESKLDTEGHGIVRMANAQDVDTIEDLTRLRQALEQGKAKLTDTQKALLQWLDDNESLF